MNLYIPFVKTVPHDDGTVTVAGRPTTEALDFDGQVVDGEFMRRALPEWFRWGNIRVGHDPHWPAGRATDLQWDEGGDPWITARIVEPRAAKLVREGVLQGFSVGIADPRIQYDRTARRGRIADGIVGEVSLVDRPANPESRIEVLKAVQGGWLDCQTGKTIPGIAGDAQLSPDSTRAGNIQPPGNGNSADFDSLGDPVLSPGYCPSDAADISVVTMTDRAVLVQLGSRQYCVPYTMESDGRYHFGEPVLMPVDPKAEPDDPRAKTFGVDSGFGPHDLVPAALDLAIVGGVPLKEDRGMEWTTAYVDDLPDSAFAYVAPGGTKDQEGRTVPRALRHLPYRDQEGEIDAPHTRNALARLSRTDIPEKAKADAREILEGAARKVGIEVSRDAKDKILKAAQAALQDTVHCSQCGKAVKIQKTIKEEKAPGGHHIVAIGECGHELHHFRPEKAVPTGQGDAGAAEATGVPTSPAERQEDDILRRLRAALDRLEQAQAEEKAGRGTEGAEERALAELSGLTRAYVAQEAQEATQEGQELRPAAEQPVQKSPRERLEEVHRHLGTLIEELPQNPVAEHDRGVLKTVNAGAGNPARGTTERQNDGGPAPVRSGQWAERIREDLAGIETLVREITGAESALVRDGDGTAHLADQSVTPPDRRPGHDQIDLLASGQYGERRPPDEDQAKLYAAEIGKAVGAVVAREIHETLGSIQKRLGMVEHMAAPARPPVMVAEPSGEFGDPQVQNHALADIRRQIAALDARQQDDLARRLVGAARRNGRT